MEMPSGSPPSGEVGSSPEHPTPAYTPGATHDAHPSPHPTSDTDTVETGETPAGEPLNATPEAGGAGDALPTENGESITTEQPPAQAQAQPPQPGDAFVIAETRRPLPPPPPPLRYGEPRPAITPNRVGEPIRPPEPVAPTAAPRPPLDPNAMPPVNSSSIPEPQEAPPAQAEHTGTVYPPAGTAPVGTPLSPQPPFQPSQGPAQPQASGMTMPQPSPPSYPYSYPPQPAPPQQPRPYGPGVYGSAPTYAPPTGGSAPAAPAGYTPANALAPAMPEVRPAGLNNRLLTIIALLLAALLLLQLFNALRPVRFDGAQPVQVQPRPLSSTTQSKVKDTLDNAQKAITDINTQAQQDYNAATTDAQRQAILAKYSFSLQQIIAQEQNDMLRIMQEQTTP